jgi:hypothetical protein
MRAGIAKVADLSGWGGRLNLTFETKRFIVAKGAPLRQGGGEAPLREKARRVALCTGVAARVAAGSNVAPVTQPSPYERRSARNTLGVCNTIPSPMGRGTG